MLSKNRIQVFEHGVLQTGIHRGVEFAQHHLDVLDRHAGTRGVPWFDRINKGIRLKSYVGVIQVKDLQIEVLPKIDNTKEKDAVWQRVLVSMLRESGMLRINDTGTSDLRLLRNSVLDLYLIRFVEECERLVHQGLVRRYRKQSGNLLVLKGALQFSKHVTENVVHKERFYTRHTVYDHDHVFNSLLCQALTVVCRINTSPLLRGRIHSLLTFFPEVTSIAVSERLFDTLPYSRNTETYRTAINIARLILLNYHPDVLRGQNHVIAMVFDMNILWERWIGKQLKKHLPDWRVKTRGSLPFWSSEHQNNTSRLRPDFLLTHPITKQTIIIDTKWKRPENNKPSEADLRQIFAYNLLFNSKHGILLYPGNETSEKGGQYHYNTNGTTLHCSTTFLNIINPETGTPHGKEVTQMASLKR